MFLKTSIVWCSRAEYLPAASACAAGLFSTLMCYTTGTDIHQGHPKPLPSDSGVNATHRRQPSLPPCFPLATVATWHGDSGGPVPLQPLLSLLLPHLALGSPCSSSSFAPVGARVGRWMAQAWHGGGRRAVGASLQSSTSVGTSRCGAHQQRGAGVPCLDSSSPRQIRPPTWRSTPELVPAGPRSSSVFCSSLSQAGLWPCVLCPWLAGLGRGCAWSSPEDGVLAARAVSQQPHVGLQRAHGCLDLAVAARLVPSVLHVMEKSELSCGGRVTV